MSDEISVRQWQERFKAGAFSARDTATQCAAGWYDWFCRDEALAGRLKKLAKVVMGVTTPFLLDNYCLWFKNNCPLDGPLYDDIRFEPLTEERSGKYFVVTLDSPHERTKWVLTTERFGFESPEFRCKNVRDMIRYINNMGLELEQNIKPPFIAEKRAVADYIKMCGEPEGLPIYREGYRRYSYTSRKDRRERTVTVAASLEEISTKVVFGRAQQVNGLYVYCSEDEGIPLPDQRVTVRKPQKRREPER